MQARADTACPIAPAAPLGSASPHVKPLVKSPTGKTYPERLQPKLSSLRHELINKREQAPKSDGEQLRDWRTELSNAQLEQKAALERADELQNKVDELQRRTRQLERSRDRDRSHIARLEGELEQKDSERKAREVPNEEMTRLKQAVRHLQRQHAVDRNRIAKLELQLDKVQETRQRVEGFGDGPPDLNGAMDMLAKQEECEQLRKELAVATAKQESVTAPEKSRADENQWLELGKQYRLERACSALQSDIEYAIK